MSVTDKKQNDLLGELIKHHNQILACEMQIDQLAERKRELVADWFHLVGEEEHDEVEGIVLLHEGHAYVIHMRKEEGETGEQMYFNADIQKMRLFKS